MKYILPVLLLCCFLNGFAQKDKTTSWVLPQKGHSTIAVTINSKALDKNHYEQIEITPKNAKVFHFSVSAGSSGFSNSFSDPSFTVQVKTKNKVFINEYVAEKEFFGTTYKRNIVLPNTDAICIFFIANITKDDTTRFFLDYTIGDTAELNYDNKTPQEVFEEMLRLPPAGSMNIAGDNDFLEFGKLNFPNGLFAEKSAAKDGFGVFQTTGERLNKTAAQKYVADWNKKIVTWLTDYNVSDIKKYTPTQLKEHYYGTDDEVTEYKKTNAQGEILFIVRVFIRSNIVKTKAGVTGTDDYNTGVSITQY